MKVLREFDAEAQHVYLIAGDRFGPHEKSEDGFRYKPDDPLRHTTTEYKERDRYRVKERTGIQWKVVKDLQWVDVSALDEKVILRLSSLLVQAKEAGKRCEATWRGDREQLSLLHKEIVGKSLAHVPESGLKLARQTVRRTAKALQFENVGIKPYVMFEGTDKGYVRRKEAMGVVSSKTVDGIYTKLHDAKRWYKRQWYEPDRVDHWNRDPRDRSNPFKAGIVHFRVVGFVDEPKANPLELLFTYVHEVSHAWADTVDNVEYNAYGMGDLGLYIRDWVSGDPEQIRERIQQDPVKLFASADFAAYAVLRTAGLIEPSFLRRKDWRD